MPLCIPRRGLASVNARRPVLDLWFADRQILDSRITFTRASVGTYFDSAVVLQDAASGAARVEGHTYNGSGWVPRGLLIWLLAGGLFYTLGVVAYRMKHVRFHHAVWHLFVLGGSACHVFGLLFYMAMA